MKRTFQEIEQIQILKKKFVEAFEKYKIPVLNPMEFEKRTSIVINKKNTDILLFIKTEIDFLEHHIQKEEKKKLELFKKSTDELQKKVDQESKNIHQIIKRYPCVKIYPNTSPFLSHLIGAISDLYKQAHLLFSSWFYGTKSWPSLKITLSKIERFCLLENQKIPIFFKKHQDSSTNLERKEQYIFQTISLEIRSLEHSITNQYNKLIRGVYTHENLLLEDSKKKKKLLVDLEKLKKEIDSIIANFRII